MTDFSRPRREMVERLAASCPVPPDPAVVSAMLEVPRHAFVEKALWHRAYCDTPLPIGRGQTLSHPGTVLAMLSALGPGAPDAMLEVGSGSGYLAAVASRICRRVYGVETMLDLVHSSRKVLLSLGMTNVRISYGDGSGGSPENAPFDCIVFSAGAPALPASILSQLADRGRLGIPVGPRDSQEFQVWTRRGEECSRLPVSFPCVFVPLTGREGWNG
jgi:protein-L-isoaspartate(D-aspartate) O-methyltransferase